MHARHEQVPETSYSRQLARYRELVRAAACFILFRLVFFPVFFSGFRGVFFRFFRFFRFFPCCIGVVSFRCVLFFVLCVFRMLYFVFCILSFVLALTMLPCVLCTS